MQEKYSYKRRVELDGDDGVTYNVDISAVINRSYSQDVPYLKNGDPGYPGWDESEIESLSYSVSDENGQQLLPTDEWEEKVSDYVLEDTDNWEFE